MSSLKTTDKVYLLALVVVVIFVSIFVSRGWRRSSQSSNLNAPASDPHRYYPSPPEEARESELDAKAPLAGQAAIRLGDADLYPPDDVPGAIDPLVTQENIQETICSAGYTKSVRPVRSFTDHIKIEQMRRLNLGGTAADYELDHLIPLELGGCPDCEANLWMEPLGAALRKDTVERHLHREVCAGRIGLNEAQQKIAQDWFSVYREILTQ